MQHTDLQLTPTQAQLVNTLVTTNFDGFDAVRLRTLQPPILTALSNICTPPTDPLPASTAAIVHLIETTRAEVRLLTEHVEPFAVPHSRREMRSVVTFGTPIADVSSKPHTRAPMCA